MKVSQGLFPHISNYILYLQVWDLISGTLQQTRSFYIPITAIVLDPAEQLLFSGTADGSIFVNTFEVGMLDHTFVDPDDKQIKLHGHK